MNNELQEKHTWLRCGEEMEGTARVEFLHSNEVMEGPCNLSVDHVGRVKIDVQAHLPLFDKQVSVPIGVDLSRRWPLRSLTIHTDLGVYTITDQTSIDTVAYECFSTHFYFHPCDMERIVSDKPAKYWVLPLLNFITKFPYHPDSEELLKHPLRQPLESVIAFNFEGRQAYIEPLPDYEIRSQRLEGGTDKSLITAVMVGEVGCNDITGDIYNTWFPHQFINFLTLATGSEVGSAWIEFRDAEGQLVQQRYIQLRQQNYVGGQVALSDFYGRQISRLLECAQASSYFRDDDFNVIMTCTIRGARSGWTYDERLRNMFSTYEYLCKQLGFEVERLRDQLPSEVQAKWNKILTTAREEIKVLAKECREAGEMPAAAALDKIRGRVDVADQKPEKFGILVVKLVQHYLFKDDIVWDKHFAQLPLIAANQHSWADFLTKYRNDVFHEAFFDTSKSYSRLRNLDVTAGHLYDLLIRILLKMVGYDGKYLNHTRASKPMPFEINWVTEDTPTSLLGYQDEF